MHDLAHASWVIYVLSLYRSGNITADAGSSVDDIDRHLSEVRKGFYKSVVRRLRSPVVVKTSLSIRPRRCVMFCVTRYIWSRGTVSVRLFLARPATFWTKAVVCGR